MRTIINLFGRSPFAPLQAHMQKIAECVHLLGDLFVTLQKQDYAAAENIATKIQEIEREAELARQMICSHLPRGLFMAVDRGALMDILALQGEIGIATKETAILTTLKQLDILPGFKDEFHSFLKLNLESFNQSLSIINEMHDLLETSFGGCEAEKVNRMIAQAGIKEHETDLTQRKLLKALYRSENEMSFGTFFLWQKVLATLSSVANLSEKLAHRVRMILELK